MEKASQAITFCFAKGRLLISFGLFVTDTHVYNNRRVELRLK